MAWLRPVKNVLIVAQQRDAAVSDIQRRSAYSGRSKLRARASRSTSLDLFRPSLAFARRTRVAARRGETLESAGGHRIADGLKSSVQHGRNEQHVGAARIERTATSPGG